MRYHDDPAEVAERFVEAGAEFLHVVDLDGAFGEPARRDVLLAVIAAAARTLPVQVGGGLRDLESLERVFEAGATRAIVGTRALTEPEFLVAAAERVGGDRLALAVDVDGEGHVRIRGWEGLSPLSLEEAFALAARANVPRVVVTGTSRDGTLEGPDLGLLARALSQSGGLAVVAAGGIGEVSHVRDLVGLRDAESGRRLEAAVVGRALYEGTLTLAEALAAAGDLQA